MTLDPLLLARIQFAWVIGWHIMLPAFTVGAASYIALLEGLHLTTEEGVYLQVSNFWIRIFAIAFGMGVVTGIVMPFQFGTNWSGLSDAAGNIIGPLMGYEGLMAFFLEAGFLGVLLFGRTLVPPWAHFIAAIMVALGALFSSFWILAANSWMQTPVGYTMVDGQFYPVDWLQIVFSPSFPYRFAHTVVAFYVTTGFVVLGVGAYTIRRGIFSAEGRVMMSTALALLAVLVPLQMFLGDQQGLNTRRYQPAKLAGIEALWNTGSEVPLTLFAVPDESHERNDYALEVPYLGSLILTHSLHGTVQGLTDFPADRRPPVAIVFWAFRIMVGLSLLMLLLVASGWWLRFRRQLFNSGLYLKACQVNIPIGFLAVLAGWTTTEVGRQPWTVYGLLRTAKSVTPSLTGRDVLLSLLVYAGAYLVVYPTGFLYMLSLVRKGPGESAAAAPIEAGRPQQPIRRLPSSP